MIRTGLGFLFTLFLVGCQSRLPDNQTPKPTPKLVQESNMPTVTIGAQTFGVEVAETFADRRQGLMDREFMPVDQGMLFVFEKPGIYPFWMKNTLIPLDIIWIGTDKRVIDFTTMQPCREKPCPSYKPKGEAQWVLEVNAGEFKEAVGALLKDFLVEDLE
jgi:uncharacterized membrane protein (UPF0127 family)